VTATLFVIAVAVAVLGIPGVLPWLQRYRASWRVAVAEQSRRNTLADLGYMPSDDPRSLVPPSSPSGVVRPPGPLPIPPLVVSSCYGPDVMVEEFKANYRASRNARNGGGGRGGDVGPGKGRPG
jgi:hypothetical protein